MKRGVIRSSLAVRDVIGIADYIAQNNLTAALRFLDAIEDTFRYLAADREAGQPCDFDHRETEGLRVWRVDGFPNYLVFFRPTMESVIVERVLHGARDFESLFHRE
jgi:toxin ParE1/3/4